MLKPHFSSVFPVICLAWSALLLTGCNEGATTASTSDGPTVAQPAPVAEVIDELPPLVVTPAAAPTAITLISPRPGRDQVSLVPELILAIEGSEALPDELSNAFELVAGSEVEPLSFVKTADGRYRAKPARLLKPETTYSLRQREMLVGADGVIEPGLGWRFTTTLDLAATSQAVIDDCMNDDAIFTLSQVNAVRMTGVRCGTDAMPTVPGLSYACGLQSAALRHSTDMSVQNFFSHTGSDGSRAGDRVSDTGYSWQTWGENIAAGQSDASQAFAELLASPGHCRNIMKASFTQFGVARFTGSGTYRHYWTQVFATPR